MMILFMKFTNNIFNKYKSLKKIKDSVFAIIKYIIIANSTNIFHI